MSIWSKASLPAAVIALAAILMAGCGGSHGGGNSFSSAGGQVVLFGTDTPICDVESFRLTITNANLLPQNGGQSAPLITSAIPATVDFARLSDFTNIIQTTSAMAIPVGTYSQLQVTLANPELAIVDTSLIPAIPRAIPASLTTTSLTVTISPALVVTANNTSGLTFDFDLRKSLQVNSSGQVTGVVNPSITASPSSSPSGTGIAEATSLYGITGTPSTSSTTLPAGFSGSFPLTLHDGTGQTVTVYSTNTTTFEGDGVSNFSNLKANTFVEVDAIVNSSGQIVAQIVDSEEPVSAAPAVSAFLGRIIKVVQNTAGNATGFTLQVDDEIPDLSSTIPLNSALPVTLSNTTAYFVNWTTWNRQPFTFSNLSIGLGEKVAVYGILSSGASPTMAASQIFLRPVGVPGTFSALQRAGSDGKTGGFNLAPCGGLFAGQLIPVITFSDTDFVGVNNLNSLAAGPTLNATGLMFYEQTRGATISGVTWTAPAWVVEAREIRQPPD